MQFYNLIIIICNNNLIIGCLEIKNFHKSHDFYENCIQ